MGGIDLGSAVLRLGADLSGLSNGLAKAERETESWAGRTSAKLQSAGAAIAGTGAKLTAGISAPLVAVGLKAVDAASDLEESISKTNVVFGDNAAAVQAWSQTTAQAMGQSRQQALEAAGTYGNLFTSMGLSQEASAAMSMDLVQLASDLGSFNNIDPTVALEKLRAGLLGEAEPLRTLGVNLNAATVEAKALEMGLAASKDELTPAMLVQARYALILEQSSNAQGDFARTSEGLSNQTRIAKAELADAAAQLGSNLLPIATQVVSKIAELVSSFTALSPETQKTILTFAGVAAAIGPLTTIIGSVTAGVGALIGAFSSGGVAATAITAIGAALGPLLPIIAAVVAAGAALYAAWRTNFLGIRDVVAEVGEVLSDAFGRIKETVGAFVDLLKGDLSLSEFGAQLSTIWSGFGEKVGTAFENIKTIVATKWAELVAKIKEKAPEILSAAAEWAGEAVGKIKEKAKEIATAAAEWIGEAVAKIKEKAPEILSAAAEWAGEAVGKIREKAKEIATAAAEWIGEAVAKIKEKAPEILSAASEWIGEAIGKIREKAKEIATAAAEWIGEAVAKIKEKAPEILSAASEWIGEAIGKIREKAGELAAAAVTWLDDTLVKVEAFDLGAAVQTLFGNVVGKIKEKAGELALAAVTWLDEALVKIEAFDLGAAVQTLFGTIIPGIATAVADVAVKVGEWLGGTSDTISEFDLGEAAKTLFGTIIPGIIEKAGEILTEVGTFLSDAATKIATHDFKSDTMTAIQTVVVGIVAKAGEILTAVGGFLGDISSAISNFSLADVAGGLIDGFVAGLQAKWASVKDTVAGIWANITGSAKTSFEEKSPSKVFMRIGEYAMQGLGLGFEAGTVGATNMLLGGLEEVVNALAAWANEQERLNKSANILSAKAVTDPLKEIVGNVAAIGNALTAIAMLRIPGNAADKIRQMTAEMGPVTLALAEFADEQERLNKSTAIQSARAVAEPLASVAGNVQRILGGLADLATVNIDPAKIAARVPAMIEALRTVVAKLAEFARTTALSDLGAAATVGPLLANAVQPFSAAASAMQTILGFWDSLAAKYKRVPIIDSPGQGTYVIYDWQAAINMLAMMAHSLHAAVADLQGKIGDLPNDLTAFAAGLRDIGGPLAATATSMQTILDFWSNLDAKYLRRPIIDSPGQGTYVIYDWQAAINMLAMMAHSLHAAVADLHRKIGDLPDELTTFAADLGAITGALQEPMALFTALSNWKPTKALPERVDALIAGITYLIEEFSGISKETRALVDEDLRRFVLAVGELGDGLQNSIAFFVDLGAWRKLPDMIDRIDDFVKTLVYLIKALSEAVDDFRADTGQQILAFGDAAGSVMDGLKSALELALALPEEWNLDSTVWDSFFTWAMDVFDDFIARVVVWEQGEVAPETVGAWGDALGAVMTGLHAALDLALAMPKTWDLDPVVWDSFFTWAMDVFDDFIARVVVWEQGEVTADTVAAWGNALGAVMGGLKAALDLALALPKTWDLDPVVWDSFFTWAMQVFDDFVVKVAVWEAGDVKADTVAAWGNALGAVMTGLKSALDLALAVPATWQAPDATTWDGFFTWATEVFWRFVTQVQTWALTQSDPDDTAGLVGAVGAAMGAVFDGLLSAIDVFKELQGYIPLLNTRIDNFLASVTYAYGLVQTYATGPGIQEGTAATTAFANATSAVFQALSTALGVFSQLVEGTNTPELLFKQRMATLIERISGTLTAWQVYVQGARDTTWLPVADAFSAAVGQVFEVLSKALGVFGTLDSQGLPSTAQLQAFIDMILEVFATFTSGLLSVGSQILGTGDLVGDVLYGEIGYDSPLYKTDMSAWGYNSANRFVFAFQNYMDDPAALGLLGDASTKLEAGIDSKIALGDTGEGVAGDLMLGIAAGLTPSNYTVSVASGMTTAIDKMVAYIVAKIESELGIASPSKVMADMALNIPSGIAQGMLAGLPGVAQAANALAAAAAPELSGLFGRDTFVTAERRIYVEIGGNAGGGAPLDAAQFDLLRRELTYAIRRGA